MELTGQSETRRRCALVVNGREYGGEMFDKSNKLIYVDPALQAQRSASYRKMQQFVNNGFQYVVYSAR